MNTVRPRADLQDSCDSLAMLSRPGSLGTLVQELQRAKGDYALLVIDDIG
jgi:hypothetical protein